MQGNGRVRWQMAGAGAFGAGPGAVAGPPPWAVAEVARRLAGIARDMEALRMQLGHVAQVDWKSPAAAAFRGELAERNAALAAAVQAMDAAAAEVVAYGTMLSSTAVNCDGPDVWQPPAAGGFGAGMGGGAGVRFGSGPGGGFRRVPGQGNG